MKKRVWICVALCALLVWAAVPSLAEDCFTIDVDAMDMNSLNSDDYVAQYLSCLLYTSVPAPASVKEAPAAPLMKRS